MAKRNAEALGKLAEWGGRFLEVASPQYKAALTKEMSRATLDLIEEGFKKESSPYGKKWRPKKIPNGQQILVEKNKMRPRFFAKVGLGKFKIINPQPYTNRHNYGWDAVDSIGRKIPTPQRQMWPNANRLPAKYIRTYTSAFTRRTFAILMGKKTRRGRR